MKLHNYSLSLEILIVSKRTHLEMFREGLVIHNHEVV